MAIENQKLLGLTELAELLAEQNSFQEILRLVTQKGTDLCQAETALILLANPQTQETVKTIFKDGQMMEADHYRMVHISVGGWVLKHQKSLLSANLKKDDRFDSTQFVDLPVKSVLAAPLKTEGTIIGTLLLINKNQDEVFDNTDINIINKLAAITAPYLRNIQKLKTYFQSSITDAALQTKYEALGLLGKSQKFIELLQSMEAASRSEVRVLLQGQTGTGKERIARAIHHFSNRADQKLLAIDCGAIPENLIESELFGHTKGAFTGATSDRKGLFEAANGGILFMDEISNLPLAMQAKLMRVLQEGEVRPLGSNVTRSVDVRVICATSQSLKELVKSGEFREDLFYRLHVYPIYVPSLSDRREDIGLLANHFLNRFSRQQKKRARGFSATLVAFMKQREWENFVERMLTIAPIESLAIDPGMIPSDLKMEYDDFIKNSGIGKTVYSLTEQLEEYEKQILTNALLQCDWNKSKAARLLKVSESNIRFRMSKLNIEKPES